MITAIILHAPNESTADAELSCSGYVDRIVRVSDPLGRGGFGELRNRGLGLVSEGWALMLDADERLIVEGERPELDESIDAYDVDSIDMYRSPRLIRAGSGARYVGLVHEYLEGAPKRALLPGVRSAEMPKSSARLESKIVRDRGLLSMQIEADPDSMRWRFYLGETERLAERWHTARHWYRGAAMRRESSSDWHREQAGWALFKGARCGWDSGEWDPVVDLVAGLVHCPWMLELPWFAAWVRWRQGELAEARVWLRMAYAIRGTGPERRGFREDGAHDLETLERAIG